MKEDLVKILPEDSAKDGAHQQNKQEKKKRVVRKKVSNNNELKVENSDLLSNPVVQHVVAPDLLPVIISHSASSVDSSISDQKVSERVVAQDGMQQTRVPVKDGQARSHQSQSQPQLQAQSQPQSQAQAQIQHQSQSQSQTQAHNKSGQYSSQQRGHHHGQKHRSHQQDNQNQKNNSDQGPRILAREQLEECSVQELNIHARRWGIIGASLMLHRELIERILDSQQHPDREIAVEGVLEKLPDGFGFLRSAQFDYVSSPDDVYVSPSQIRRMGLRTGDTVLGAIRKQKENEKYFALAKIDKVNFEDPIRLNERPTFDRLSPMHPNKKFTLEFSPNGISTRLMDMFTPIGRGQRGLIVAPPKAGKTMLLKEIAQSLIANHPDVYLMVLLVDERPEEVADMRRCIKGAHAEVVSSTFDESADRHVQVAEIVLEKAKRLVESGKDVVILLDAITRLARAYNTTAPASGKVLTGVIDANALQRPKRFFGAARKKRFG